MAEIIFYFFFRFLDVATNNKRNEQYITILYEKHMPVTSYLQPKKFVITCAVTMKESTFF